MMKNEMSYMLSLDSEETCKSKLVAGKCVGCHLYQLVCPCEAIGSAVKTTAKPL